VRGRTAEIFCVHDALLLLTMQRVVDVSIRLWGRMPFLTPRTLIDDFAMTRRCVITLSLLIYYFVKSGADVRCSNSREIGVPNLTAG
jgi:hypothetical protein